MKQRLDTTYTLFDLALRPTAAEDPLNQGFSGGAPAVGSASSTSTLPATPGAFSGLQTSITSPYAMAKQLVPMMHLSPPCGDSPTGASSLSSRGAASDWGALTSRIESRLHLLEQYASPSRSSNSTGGTDTLLSAVNSALSVADLWSYMDIHDRIIFNKGQNIWDPSRSHVFQLAQQQQLGGKFGGRIMGAVLDKIQQLSVLQQQQQQQGVDAGLNASGDVSLKKLHFGSVAEIMADWVALLLQPTSFERYGLDLRGTLPEEITQQMWHYSDHWDDRQNLGHPDGDLIAADPEVICSLLLSLVTEMVKPTNWSITAACDLITAVSSSSTRGSSSSSIVALCMRDAVDAVQAASLQLLTPAEAYTIDPSSSSSSSSSSSETGSQNNISRKAAKLEHQSEYNEHQLEILSMGLSWSCLVSVLQMFAATAYKPTAAWGAAATNLALAYARQPGSSNAAAAVPMMLQLLVAAGVRPSSNEFEAAVDTYTKDLVAVANCWAGSQLQPAAGAAAAAAAAAARQLACEISVLIPCPDQAVKVLPFTPQQLRDCTFMAAAAAVHYESHPMTQRLQIMTLLSWQGPAGKLLMQQQQQQQGQQDEEVVIAGLVASALHATVVLSAMEPKIAAAAAMAAMEDTAAAAAAAAVTIPEVAELRSLEQRKAAAYLQWQQTAVAQLRASVTTILQEAAAALVSQQQQQQQFGTAAALVPQQQQQHQQQLGTTETAAAGSAVPMDTGAAGVASVAAASNHSSSSSSSTLGLRAVQLLAAAAVLSASQFDTDQIQAAAAAAAGATPTALVAAAIAVAADSQAHTAAPHTFASTCSCELCNIQRVINITNSSANPASNSSSSGGSGGARADSCLLYSAEMQQQLQHLAEADLFAAAAAAAGSSSLVLRYLAVIPGLGVRPSQQFVDAVISNMVDHMLPLQTKQRSSQPVIMFRSKVDPKTVEAKSGMRYFDLARQQAVDSWFSAAVDQMLGLASANAPMPSGNLLTELLQLLHTAALYSSSSSSSSTKLATSASETLLSGDTTSSSSSRGCQWLQLFVWLYCSKKHRPDCFWDHAFVPEWLVTGVTSALGTVQDNELIQFVDQYLAACRRPLLSTAAAAAAAAAATAAAAAVTAAAGQSGSATAAVLADEEQQQQQQADFLTNRKFLYTCNDSGVCQIWKAAQQQLQARLAAALQTLQQQQQGSTGSGSCCCMAYCLLRALICSTSSKYCPIPRYHSLSNSYMEEVMKHLADITQNSDQTLARILSDLWSAVADLQQQGVLGQIRWGEAAHCYDLAITALVSRLVQGLMPLPEAAAAVYALQRIQAQPGNEEAEPMPLYYDRWWFAGLRFSWLPQLLMVDLYKETARSTALWPMHSTIPAALGPALLALHLSGWPYHSGTSHAYRVYQYIEWQVLRSDSSSSSKVPERRDLSSVAAKAALEQLIASAAMNAHLFTTQQMAQVAYGLLLMAAPRKSAAAAAAGSGAGSSESVDDMPYPVLALKSSAAVAPHILSINQQLLQRMLQMISGSKAAAAAAAAAAAGTSPAAAVPPASTAAISPGCIVHATVVLVCCGLWSAPQAVGNLVQLTAGKLSSMTWRELAQAVHLLYMCSGLDSSAGATADAATVGDSPSDVAAEQRLAATATAADAAAVGDSSSDMVLEPQPAATGRAAGAMPLDHNHLLSPTAATAADAPCNMAVEQQPAATSLATGAMPLDHGYLPSPMRLDAEILAHASCIERWPVGWVAQAVVNDEGCDEEVSVLADMLQRGQVHTGGTTSSASGHTLGYATMMLDIQVKQQVVSWLGELKSVIAVSYDELPDAQQLAKVFDVMVPALEARVA